MNRTGFLPLLGIVLFLTLSGCGGSNDSKINADLVTKPTSISIDNERYEFGQVTQGEKVEHVFNFTNTGTNDLVLTSVKGSCSCTVPEWPKRPFKPGESGEIKVVFNTEGKRGKQHKTVTVIANTEPSTTVMVLSGEVVAPDNQ